MGWAGGIALPMCALTTASCIDLAEIGLAQSITNAIVTVRHVATVKGMVVSRLDGLPCLMGTVALARPPVTLALPIRRRSRTFRVPSKAKYRR